MSFGILVGLLLIWGTVLLVHRSSGRQRGLWSSPYSWFVIVWLVQFILLSLPIFEYFDPISFSTALIILGAHVAVASGMVVALMTKVTVEPDLSNVNGSRHFVIVGGAIGAGAQTILSANTLIGSGISLASRLNSSTLSQTRLQNFEFNTYLLGPLYGPMTIAAAVCFAVIPYFAFCWGRRVRWARTLSVEALVFGATVLSVIFSQLLNAGRMNMLFLGLLVAISATLGQHTAGIRMNWVVKQGKRSAIIAAVIALSIVSAMFQGLRDHKGAPLRHLVDSHGTTVTAPLYNTANSNSLGGWYLLQLSYITTPPHILAIYTDLPQDQQPGPFFGRYNFHVIYRNLFRFAPSYDPEFWGQDRKELFRPQVWLGRNGNVWSTMLRDLRADFGVAGMMMFLFAFGFYVQRQSDNFSSAPTPARAALTTVLRIICLFSALISVFFLSWTVATLIVLAFASAAQRKVTVSARRRESGAAASQAF